MKIKTDNTNDNLSSANSEIKEPQILLLSAETAEELQKYASLMKTFIQKNIKSQQDLILLCRSSANASKHNTFRHGFTAISIQNVLDEIDRFLNNLQTEQLVSAVPENANKILFVFSGHGAQYIETGKELYSSNSNFKKIADQINDKFIQLENFNVLEFIFHPSKVALPDQFQHDHQITFFLQVCLAKFLLETEITPSGVLGHSMGEIAAAVVAEVMSLDTGIKLITKRGKLIQTTYGVGRTLAITATESQLSEYMKKYKTLNIAAINTSNNITVSGGIEEIQELYDDLMNEEIYANILTMPVAAHSTKMDALCQEYEEYASGFKYSNPKLDYFSTTDGSLKIDNFNAAYWRSNLRKPVQFLRAIEAAIQHKYQIFLEVDPHPVLQPYLTQNIFEVTKSAFVISTLNKEVNDNLQWAECLGALYNSGITIPIISQFAKEPVLPMKLPDYHGTNLAEPTVKSKSDTLNAEQIKQEVIKFVDSAIKTKITSETAKIALVDLGLKSLKAFQVCFNLKDQLKVNISPKTLLGKEMTIDSLVAKVIEVYQNNQPQEHDQSSNENKYFEILNLDPSAKTNIFCFANLGGGSLFYKSFVDKVLEKKLQANIYFFSIPDIITLPPGENQFDFLLNKWQIEYEKIIQNKSEKAVFLGHSLGSLFAIDFANRLRLAEGAEPSLMLLANCFPVTLKDLYLRPMMYEKTTAELIEWIAMDQYFNLPLEKTIEIIAKPIEHNLAFLKNENFNNAPMVTAPLQLFNSKEDPMWADWHIEEWRKQAKDEIIQHEIAGGHFAIVQNWDLVIEQILANEK